jgi:SAM-dependent MidA family methyltransferase
MKTENGKEMQNFLKTLLEKKKQDIEYYKSSNLHIFESNEDVIKRQRDAFSSTK